MTQQPKKLHVTTREAWRRWLREHHKRESEVLLVYNKAHTGRPRLPYQDALEEALCFGWIDAQVRRIDDDRYGQRWTPRRPGSRWSKINIALARRLIKEKRMTKAGLAAFEDGLTRPASGTPPRVDAVPDDLTAALRRNKQAREFFESLAPSYRRRYLGWITGAKRDETRERRVKETVQLLARRVKSLMK